MRLLSVVIMLFFSISAVADDEQLLKCTVSLQNYEAEYPWYSEYDGSIDDGVAPLVTFRIVEPQKYSGKTISILFKYQYYQKMLPALSTGKGKKYSLYLPIGFLNSAANIIDVSSSLGLANYGP